MIDLFVRPQTLDKTELLRSGMISKMCSNMHWKELLFLRQRASRSAKAVANANYCYQVALPVIEPFLQCFQTTHAPAEFILLGRSVLNGAEDGEPEVDAAYFLTTAVDDTADNRYTEKLVVLWGGGNMIVSSFQFDASQNVPHNSVDPATDTAIRTLIYDKILEIIETKE